jgi:hypothetical protein
MIVLEFSGTLVPLIGLWNALSVVSNLIQTRLGHRT